MKQIDDIIIHEAIPPMFGADDFVALDIEIFGGVKGKLHRPIGEFASIAVTRNGVDVYVTSSMEELPLFVYAARQGTVCIQNAAFDICQLRRWVSFPPTDNLHDTMLIERILYGGYYDEKMKAFGLKALARRHLGVYIEKDITELFEKAKTMSAEMTRYNAIDCAATWRIGQKQLKLMKKSDQRVWCEIDMPALWAFLDFKGPMLDVERWKQIAEENKSKSEERKKDFPFNPNAHEQVRTYLNQTYELNLPNTQEATVAPLAKKYPIIQEVLDYRKVEKQRSTYGMNWIKNHVEADGRVYTSYDVNRAESGRVASSNPNVQNIPFKRTRVYRECFIAAPGYVLVGGDYNAQEMRIVAYMGKDERMIAFFGRGDDIYAESASELYGEKVAKDDPRRDPVKSLMLGLIFGMSAPGLASRMGMTEDKAEHFIAKFFKTFPGIQAYMDKQERATKWVKTPFGRRSWLNLYSGQSRRNALNSPIQGGAADMIKLATALLWRRWNRKLEPFPAILQVHDEIVLEVLEENAEYAKELLEECMMQAGERIIPGVPIGVSVRIGKTWADVH